MTSVRDNRASEDMKKTVNFSIDSKESVREDTHENRDKLVKELAEEEVPIRDLGQRLQHSETENGFDEDIITRGKAAVRKRSIENRKNLENHIQGLSEHHNELLSHWINGGNIYNADMNGNLNGSDISSLTGKSHEGVPSEHYSKQRHGSKKILSIANVKENDTRCNGVSNESINESHNTVQNGRLLNGSIEVTLNGNGQVEEDIPQNNGHIHKNKNNRKSHSSVISLKQFGFDRELDIRYIPPLRCSQSHQQPKFNMDGWKRRVSAKKHLVKLTKADTVAENGSECNTMKENGFNSKSQNTDRGTNQSLENKTLDESVLTYDSLYTSATFDTHNQDDFSEKFMQSGELSETDNSGKAFGDDNGHVGDDDELLPLPKKPVYDAHNSSTAMILLNKRDERNSRLWRMNTSQPINRGNLINPARHANNTVPTTVHARCRSTNLEKYDHIKPIFALGERPQSEKIGDRLHEGRMSVNPRRHRACAVNGSHVSLDSSQSSCETRKDGSSSYKNRWLRIYSKPHERREPTGINKSVPNFREKISSPAWSSTNSPSIYNRKTKA